MTSNKTDQAIRIANAEDQICSEFTNDSEERNIILPHADPVELEKKWPPKPHQRITKRVFDITISILLLSILLPLMLAVVVLIRLSSKGAAIYTQKRLTVGGRYFVIYKFRTMAKNAEQDSGAKMADLSDMRVTKVGKFLRRTRIDELPQLLNVVIGDMSLIGPRPERPEIARKLQKELPHLHRRVNVKAGLTGLAQINLGYVSTPETYKEKLEWDLKYIDDYSLLLDMKIAFRTISVILTGYGAR